MNTPGRMMLMVLAVVPAVACSTATERPGSDVREIGEHLRLAHGPELDVALSSAQAARSAGDDTLILAVSLAGTADGRRTVVDRGAVSVRTPDGRRIPLMTQAGYRGLAAALYGPSRRAAITAPTLVGTGAARRACGEWFFADPGIGLARDVLRISSFEACDGLLYFPVPGGVQPGRWQLEVRLEESTIEIPFTVERP